MISRHMKLWVWLLAFATGLIFLGAFAPLSGSLDGILTGVATAILLSYVCLHLWEGFRERRANRSSSAAISSKDQV